MNDADIPPLLPRWDYSNLNFHEYISWAQKYIISRRKDLTPHNYDQIMLANSPYELRPSPLPAAGKYKHGVLLIHGLLDSPFSLREIGQHLQQRGFLVRAILLPGHGTTADDLLTVQMDEWQAAVKFGINSLATEVEHSWIVGFSGGASLGLLYALQNPGITGLMLLAPSLKLRNGYARYASFLNFLSRYAKMPIWLGAGDNQDYAKYDTYPANLAAQAYRLTQAVMHQAQQQPCQLPLWIAVSEDDETIDSHTVKKFFMQQPNNMNQLLWYGHQPLTPTESTITFRTSAYPDDNIVDFSHICLSFTADNFHYGRHGDYQLPVHIPKNGNDNIVYYGALTDKNLEKYAIRRLTYNPDFTFLIEQLDKFINTIC